MSVSFFIEGTHEDDNENTRATVKHILRGNSCCLGSFQCNATSRDCFPMITSCSSVLVFVIINPTQTRYGFGCYHTVLLAWDKSVTYLCLSFLPLILKCTGTETIVSIGFLIARRRHSFSFILRRPTPAKLWCFTAFKSRNTFSPAVVFANYSGTNFHFEKPNFAVGVVAEEGASNQQL